MRRGALRLLSVVVCSASLAACSPGAGSRIEQHVLRIADTSDPETLNPLLAHDQDTIGWDQLYAQTLVGLDARNETVPILVTRVPSRANGDVSRDGKTIVYHLRRGIRFADGIPLTSADVAFTYRAILDPRNNVLSVDAYQRIASLQILDAHTVVIHLRSPWNAAPNVLFAQADFAFGILPKHAFTGTDVVHSAWDQHPFGTGPFKVVEWRRSDRIVLEPNPYWAPKPRLQRIILRMIPNSNSAFVALRTHEVDIAALTPDELPEARDDTSFHIVRTPENATVWFSLQTQGAPTNDLRVRRAIVDAIDVEAMRKAYSDAYEPAASFLPPVFTRWQDRSIRVHRYDPRRAAAELDAAGWNMQGGTRVKQSHPLDGVLVFIAGRALEARIATIAQEQLATAGIHVTIKAFPTALFNAPDGPIRNGRYTLSEDGWLGGGDPEQSVVFACSQVGLNGNNISRFCDARMDALFADQQRTQSETRRHADFIEMQQIVHDRLPVVPLYYETYLEGVDTHVSGFARNMLRYPVDAQNWDVHT